VFILTPEIIGFANTNLVLIYDTFFYFLKQFAKILQKKQAHLSQLIEVQNTKNSLEM